MHVSSYRRLLLASSLALSLSAPALASTGDRGGGQGFRNRTPSSERFLTPQSGIDRAYKSQLTTHVVRGKGIEEDIANRNRRGLLNLMEFLFKNEFAKGDERRYISRQLDLLVKGEHMFAGAEKGQVVLGMSLALGNYMRAVARSDGGRAYLDSAFGTFVKIAPEKAKPLGQIKAWVLSDEKPEALADRLAGTAGGK